MPSTATTHENTSKAGISTSEDGQRFIASSLRSDGSVRKEIRVRPGYKPPEDVEVYKNRTAEAWKTRGAGGVPGAAPVEVDEKKSAAAQKNAKRKEARKKAAAEGAAHGEETNTIIGSEQHDTSSGPTQSAVEPSQLDAATEKEKEARKLTKKLRQARELKDKKEKGDALLPEQFEKVIKITELIRQLEMLGFDANGEKKDDTPKG